MLQIDYENCPNVYVGDEFVRDIYKGNKLVWSAKKIPISKAKNGVYVLGTDGYLYDPDTFEKNYNYATGIAIIHDNCRFVINPRISVTLMKYSDITNNSIIDNSIIYSSAETVLNDFDGIYNTEITYLQLKNVIGSSEVLDRLTSWAPIYCRSNKLNGVSGYLGSVGEMGILGSHYNYIKQIYSKVWGKTFELSAGMLCWTSSLTNNSLYNWSLLFAPTISANFVTQLNRTGTPYIIPLFPLIDNSAEYIDFNLPSGTLWSTRNVGASKITEEGLYFAYGETEGYTNEEAKSLSWKNYKWCEGSGDTLTKYNTDPNRGIVDNKTTLDLEDDAAHVYMGGDWRTPTFDQYSEFFSEVIESLSRLTNNQPVYNFRTIIYEIDNVKGILIYPRNNNSKLLFIPLIDCSSIASNDYNDICFSNRDLSGNNGRYTQLYGSDISRVDNYKFTFKYIKLIERYIALPIRGVLVKK